MISETVEKRNEKHFRTVNSNLPFADLFTGPFLNIVFVFHDLRDQSPLVRVLLDQFFDDIVFLQKIKDKLT